MDVKKSTDADPEVHMLTQEVLDALALLYHRRSDRQVGESAEDGRPIVTLANGRSFRLVLNEIVRLPHERYGLEEKP